MTDFKNNQFSGIGNDLKEQLETFLTGKLKVKKSDGREDLVDTGKTLVGSASDYMNTLIALLGLDSLPDFNLMTYNKPTDLVSRAMSVVNGDPAQRGLCSLEDMVDAYLYQLNPIQNYSEKLLNAPKHLILSTEGITPAELLHMLSNSSGTVAQRGGNEMEFSLNDVNNVSHRYRLKSMVCRSTPQTLLTEGNVNVINTQLGTHFVSVINTGNKFIKIDSLSPQTIESCPNDHLINFVKTSSGTYLMPVLMMFEKISSTPNGM